MAASGGKLAAAAARHLRPPVGVLHRVADAVSPWGAIGMLQRPWRALDEWTAPPPPPRAPAAVATAPAAATPAPAAEWLDLAVARIKSRNVLHPFAFYPHGWGATHLLPVFARQLSATAAAAAAVAAGHAVDAATAAAAAGIGAISVVHPMLQGPPRRTPTAWVVEGVFESPPLSPPLGLPPASRRAAFQCVLPATGPASYAAGCPLVICLPGTGEQGYARRRHCVAYPLAARGVATLILEGPYYGSRKPTEQVGSKLASVVDLCVLGRTTIEEARALAVWARALPASAIAAAIRGTGGADGGGANGGGGAFGDIVYAGTSMGGLHAAMSASLSPFPAGVVSWLGPPSAAPVFTVGALADAVAWDAMTAQLTAPGGASVARHVADMEAILRLATPAAVEADHVGDTRRAMAARHTPRRATARSGAAAAVRRSPDVPHAVAPVQRHLAAVRAALQYAAAVPGVTHTPPAAASRAAAYLASAAAAHDRAAPASAAARAGAHAAAHAYPDAGVAARCMMARLLRVTDLTNFVPPRRPDAAFFTYAAHDKYIPAGAGTAVAAMWRTVAATWRGATIRVIRGGHVSGSVFSLDAYVATIGECVAALASASAPRRHAT